MAMVVQEIRVKPVLSLVLYLPFSDALVSINRTQTRTSRKIEFLFLNSCEWKMISLNCLKTLKDRIQTTLLLVIIELKVSGFKNQSVLILETADQSVVGPLLLDPK